MPFGRTRVLVAVALGSLLLPSAAGARSPSAPASPDAASPAPASASPSVAPSAAPSAVPGVRSGWTLEVSEEPPFSVQLPEGWTRGAASNGFAATTAAGGQMALTVEPLPTEADFVAWVRRIETDLETAAELNLPTVFREVGTGVIARIELGAAPGATDGATTTRFLYPFCADGTRTLDITGPAPDRTDAGQPDVRDELASGANPCAVEPAPVRVLDPEVLAAAATYVTMATTANDAIDEAYLPLMQETTLKVWHTQSRIIGRIEDQLIADLGATTWPASIKPLVDPLVARHQDAAKLWGVTFAKAKGPKVITSRFDDLERVSTAIGDAGRDVRFALGLPTNAR